MNESRAIYFIDDGVIEEHIDIQTTPLALNNEFSTNANNSVSSNLHSDTNESQIAREYNYLIQAQRRLTKNNRSFCLCGCMSPEVLLSTLTIFWVVIAFYEGLRDFEIKHFEAVTIYLMAFCLFGILVSAQLRFFFVSCAMCLLHLLWNTFLLSVLVGLHDEREFYLIHKQHEHENLVRDQQYLEHSYYLVAHWPDLYKYLLRIINEDYYSFVFVYVLKILFIIMILITTLQVRYVQNIETELRYRRRLIGELLGEMRGATDMDIGVDVDPMEFNAAMPPYAENQQSVEWNNIHSMSRSLVTCTSGSSLPSLIRTLSAVSLAPTTSVSTAVEGDNNSLSV